MHSLGCLYHTRHLWRIGVRINSAIIKTQLVMTRWDSLAAKVAGADPLRAIEYDDCGSDREQHVVLRHVTCWFLAHALPLQRQQLPSPPQQQVSSSPGSRNDSFVAVVSNTKDSLFYS